MVCGLNPHPSQLYGFEKWREVSDGRVDVGTEEISSGS
jgi:hypothetical protein